MTARSSAFAAAAALVTLAACQGSAPLVEVQGECGDAFQAQICTWATMQGDSLVEMGAIVPIASIENAPAEGEMVWPPQPTVVAAVPAGAQQASGLNHLTVFWEPHGHPPGPYLTPHFDFHFYFGPSAGRNAIDCADSSKPSALPAAYALPDVKLPPPMAKMMGTNTLVGLCVPEMGMHALLASELASAELFRGTMVVGYYGGTPIFVEPMLTRAMLLERRSFELAIPEIPGLSGAYPRQFRADYDAEAEAYRFVFSAFAGG